MLYYQIGRIYESKYDNFEALKYFDKSIILFQNIHNLQRTIQVKIQKANIYFNLKDYDKAECEYLKMYEESQKYGYKRRTTACTNNLAFLYFVKYDYINSLKFIQLSRGQGTDFSDINYFEAYIIYKTKDVNTARKEMKRFLSYENTNDVLLVLKLINYFVIGILK